MNKKVNELIDRIDRAKLLHVLLVLSPDESEILYQYITSLEEKLETEHKAYMGTVKELTETATRINKALHRIQLLQMDGEVFIRDLGLIVRDLEGSDK